MGLGLRWRTRGLVSLVHQEAKAASSSRTLNIHASVERYCQMPSLSSSSSCLAVKSPVRARSFSLPVFNLTTQSCVLIRSKSRGGAARNQFSTWYVWSTRLSFLTRSASGQSAGSVKKVRTAGSLPRISSSGLTMTLDASTQTPPYFTRSASRMESDLCWMLNCSKLSGKSHFASQVHTDFSSSMRTSQPGLTWRQVATHKSIKFCIGSSSTGCSGHGAQGPHSLYLP
mmetsp:Transcript_56359/g.123755  ORF Transcript_56359/g.123755 Transcript_56359/m.123755 type:complete len:228 (+) Transcript_56359:382-1065(+)